MILKARFIVQASSFGDAEKMSSKKVIDFYGNVSQVVVGNVIEVSRQCNVVNLTIDGWNTEFQALTKLQQQDASSKVKTSIESVVTPSLGVYHVSLSNFGANSNRALSCNTCMAAMPCASCIQHAAGIKPMRLTAVVQWTLLVGLVLLCFWLLLPSAVDAAPKSDVDTRCFVDGKAYSMGSFIRMPNGAICECMNNGPNGVPRWSTGKRE